MPAVLGGRLEVLGDVIWHEDRDTTHPAVLVRGVDRLAKIVFARHVVDRVMDKDRIEDPAQPQRPHVCLDVLTLRIELP